MAQTPDPAKQRVDAARERGVARILAPLPRALAHVVKDALMLAWNDGYEYRGKNPGP